MNFLRKNSVVSDLSDLAFNAERPFSSVGKPKKSFWAFFEKRGKKSSKKPDNKAEKMRIEQTTKAALDGTFAPSSES